MKTAPPSRRTASGFVAGCIALALVACTAPTPASAAASSVGLSPVRAQVFGNESLGFFEPAEFDRFGQAVAAGDFNGDGYADLATGMPYDDGLVGSGLTDVGIVVVRWGTAGGGLETGNADTVLSQFAGGSQGDPESTDHFGWALAAGDFNGDGRDDLAVGVPGDFVPNPDPDSCGGDFVRAGSVVIHYGLPDGIQTAGEHWATQGRLLPCGGDFGDAFGTAIAAGDFNGDGWDDLAVGIPWRDFGQQTNAGAVMVFYGGAGGVVPWNTQYVSQAFSYVEDTVETGDEFGLALATGDMNHDSREDLVVGVPGEDGSGAAQLFLGGAAALVIADDVLWSEAEVVGAAGAGDRFGEALALADFDGDGYDDLAIGAPRADPSVTFLDSGRLSLVHGDAAILTATIVAQSFTQGSITGDPQADGSNDQFGRALAAGDFDADGLPDLAVGQPRETKVTTSNGGVTILPGSTGGGFGGRYRSFHPGVEGVPPDASPENTMGASLAVGDFDGDGHSDLATGLPQRDVSGQNEIGAVTVLYGALFADGFGSGSFAYWSDTSP